MIVLLCPDTKTPPLNDILDLATPHCLSQYTSCLSLSINYSSFLSTLDSQSNPTTVTKDLSNSRWQHATIVEMTMLHYDDTSELVLIPTNKFTVECKWVFFEKTFPKGIVDRLKPNW